jgi:hypothetical protein
MRPQIFPRYKLDNANANGQMKRHERENEKLYRDSKNLGWEARVESKKNSSTSRVEGSFTLLLSFLPYFSPIYHALIPSLIPSAEHTVLDAYARKRQLILAADSSSVEAPLTP